MTQTYTTQTVLPESVSDFFNTLRSVGDVTFHSAAMAVQVVITTDDLYDLRTKVVDMETTLSTLTGTRFGPIARPEAIIGAYVVKVPMTDDVRSYLDIITGLAAIGIDTAPETIEFATVTFEVEDGDEYDLATLVAEVNSELGSLGIGAHALDRPTPVA